jgi:hypothetical protein
MQRFLKSKDPKSVIIFQVTPAGDGAIDSNSGNGGVDNASMSKAGGLVGVFESCGCSVCKWRYLLENLLKKRFQRPLDDDQLSYI